MMGKAKLILGLAVLALAGVEGWRIAWCELANFELHEEARSSAKPKSMRFTLNLSR